MYPPQIWKVVFLFLLNHYTYAPWSLFPRLETLNMYTIRSAEKTVQSTLSVYARCCGIILCYVRFPLACCSTTKSTTKALLMCELFCAYCILVFECAAAAMWYCRRRLSQSAIVGPRATLAADKFSILLGHLTSPKTFVGDAHLGHGDSCTIQKRYISQNSPRFVKFLFCSVLQLGVFYIGLSELK